MAVQETLQFYTYRFGQRRPEELESFKRNSDKKQGKTEHYLRELMDHKEKKENVNVAEHLAQYNSLLKAIASKDWKKVKVQWERQRMIDGTTPITESYESILHMLVNSSVKALSLVKEILEKTDSDSLVKTDYQGDTALNTAAYAGNVKAAEMIATRNPSLLETTNYIGDSPFLAAARYGHERTFRSLLNVAQKTGSVKDKTIFSGPGGANIVERLISANRYGLALELLNCYPKLCRENLGQRKNILKILAGKPLEFKSGCKFGPWERLIYKAISVKDEVVVPRVHHDSSQININVGYHDADPKTGPKKNIFAKFRQLAYYIIGKIFPRFEIIRQEKLMNEQARQVLKSMFSEVNWTFPDASFALRAPLLKAARLGIKEIVQEILWAYSGSMMFTTDDNDYNILQLAVLHRREKVFNLIFKMGLSQRLAENYKHNDELNILHLAGKCVPSGDINGSAMQMQWEMQWFKAVESFVHPLVVEQQNKDKKTAREVFDENHKELVKNGEKWMRNTASSCMVVDALIIAMVFAAIIAVPGNNEKGIPNFRHETLFKVFVVTDAAALFTSSLSLLLFVPILTSRYAEEDFLKTLPTMLFLGLMTLIFSIATMLVASGSALIMLIDAVPGPKVTVKTSTVIPVVVMALFPVVFFIWSQSTLLVEVFLSTYRPKILSYKWDF